MMDKKQLDDWRDSAMMSDLVDSGVFLKVLSGYEQLEEELTLVSDQAYQAGLEAAAWGWVL